jgi:hypothetical protein
VKLTVNLFSFGWAGDQYNMYFFQLCIENILLSSYHISGKIMYEISYDLRCWILSADYCISAYSSTSKTVFQNFYHLFLSISVHPANIILAA